MALWKLRPHAFVCNTKSVDHDKINIKHKNVFVNKKNIKKKYKVLIYTKYTTTYFY